MYPRTEPLKITFSISPESVRSLFDVIAGAAGNDAEIVTRQPNASRNPDSADEEPASATNLMVTRKQAAALLQLSTRTLDNLKRDGRMSQPIRIGTAVRWSRAELAAWVDAGCPD